MVATQRLRKIGQGLRIDYITRDQPACGMIERYVPGLSITGLVSKPTIYDHAIQNSRDDDANDLKLKEDRSGEPLFFDLAIEDIRQAIYLFRPAHGQTNGVDGSVLLEVLSWLVHHAEDTLAAATALHERAASSIASQLG